MYDLPMSYNIIYHQPEVCGQPLFRLKLSRASTERNTQKIKHSRDWVWSYSTNMQAQLRRAMHTFSSRKDAPCIPNVDTKKSTKTICGTINFKNLWQQPTICVFHRVKSDKTALRSNILANLFPLPLLPLLPLVTTECFFEYWQVHYIASCTISQGHPFQKCLCWIQFESYKEKKLTKAELLEALKDKARYKRRSMFSKGNQRCLNQYE